MTVPEPDARLQNSADGSFRFLPGNSTYAKAVVLRAGWSITAYRFARPVELKAAFGWLDLHRGRMARGSDRLVALHQRIPRPYTTSEFAELNTAYLSELDKRDLLLDGRGTFARTTVVDPYSSTGPTVATMFLAVQRPTMNGLDFVVSGISESQGGFAPENITAFGDSSPTGLGAKRNQVLAELRNRLSALEVQEASALEVNVYSRYPIPELRAELERNVPGVRRTGYIAHPALPPVLGLDFEVDCHRAGRRVEVETV